MQKLRATVTIEDVPDGAKIIIEYADGHTVYMVVGPESIVLRRHLGIEQGESE